MNAVVEFSPEKAWQAAITYLKMEMSRVDFNTWVKPIQLVEYSNDNFVIGCINIYGQNWLENRLSMTLQKFLSGVLNREVKIRFVIYDQGVDDEDGICQEEKDNSKNNEENPIDLDIHYSSIRNFLLEPERIVRLPVYYFRWMPYVGSRIIFLVMAMWQEYFLASEGKKRKGSCKVSVRAERICQWAGMSRAQFFRLLQPGSKLGWFARKIETDYEIDKRSGRTKKSSNKYEIYESPLTPGDAEDLSAFLVSHGIKETPESALQIAVSANPKEILQYPVQCPPEDFEKMLPSYQTVQSVIKKLVGHRLDGELENLANQLANRLTGPGDFILVSWYFLKNWLPVLGSDAAMFVLILRNLCYFNDAIGEIRDEVWMDGGYESIAIRLGIKNPRIVANWLPARIDRGKRKEKLSERTNKEISRRQHLQDLLGLFVQRTDHRLNAEGSYGWKFKVQRIDPLTPQHQAIQQAASTLLMKSEDQFVLDELDNWISKLSNDCAQRPRAQREGLASARLWRETINPEAMIVSRLSDLSNDCSDTLKGILNDCLETLDLQAKDCFETLLKILKSFKDSKKVKDSSTTQDASFSQNESSSRAVAVVTDSNGNWSLDKLLARADRKNRSVLVEQENTAIPFVSWIIYGVSQSTIQNPYSLAIAKLKENPGVGAGGASERLAAMSPREFAILIEQSFSFYGSSNKDWQMLFSVANNDRIQLLVDLLGLVLNTKEDHWQI
ncbi:MAG: hypothetical protein CL609_22150 [Anaerolineaceae bacterium]|jgi:hypothetical protein|nr:hypothetical protein [Anaerolineaceae bacterium]